MDEVEIRIDLVYRRMALAAIAPSATWGLAAPAAEATWGFHITDHFGANAKLGLGWHFELYPRNTSRVPGLTTNGFGPVGGAGIDCELSEAMIFRAELGYLSLRAGIAFAF